MIKRTRLYAAVYLYLIVCPCLYIYLSIYIYLWRYIYIGFGFDFAFAFAMLCVVLFDWFAGTHSLWSAFTIGQVHYLLLDSEADTWCASSQNKAQQLAFAEADLSKVDRDATPWVVVAIHRPLYSSCANFKEQQTMQNGFSALFSKYKIDVVLNGHVHSYERTLPVTGNYSNTTNATVQPYGDGITQNRYLNPKYPVCVHDKK